MSNGSVALVAVHQGDNIKSLWQETLFQAIGYFHFPGVLSQHVNRSRGTGTGGSDIVEWCHTQRRGFSRGG